MIQMIAVDMDGTFLDDQKMYDESRFARQFNQIKKQGIKFIVASGNQYIHLANYFPGYLEDLCFICENGALIVEQKQVIYECPLDPILINELLKLLLEDERIALDRLILSGEKASYILSHTKKTFIESGKFFYHNLRLVDSLYDLPDKIYKITVNFRPDKKEENLETLKATFQEQANILTSGVKAVDIVSRNAGKEKAIDFLQNRMGISDRALACFGDNMNDLGMIKKAAYGFVMGNGKEALKQYAYKIVGTNNEQAVLQEIDWILSLGD